MRRTYHQKTNRLSTIKNQNQLKLKSIIWFTFDPHLVNLTPVKMYMLDLIDYTYLVAESMVIKIQDF